MLRRTLTVAVLGICTALMGGAAGAQTTMRSADIHPDGYPTVEAVKYFGSLLEKKTNGRYKVQVFHSAQLGQEKDTIEQTRFGVIDLNRINMGPFNNLIPETLVPSLPFIFRSVDHVRKAMDAPGGEQSLKASGPHGLGALAFCDSGAPSLNNKKRVNNPPADQSEEHTSELHSHV